ncbi:MAG: LysR family transcriptional regulator [Chitinophagaceae bacterium]|nr:LysR family transcriptional regulator [Oligoflexus sp.]
MNHYNFNHLYYFFTAAQAPSISEAAKQLKIRQPTLTSQLRTLEDSLGKRLFEKKGRKLTLTHDGRNILQYCEQIFGPAVDFDHYVRGNLLQKAGHFRIGLSIELDRIFATSLLSCLTDDSDNELRITLTSGDFEELIHRLKLNVYDAILTTQESGDPDLVLLAEANLPVALVYSPEHFEAKSISAPDRLEVSPNRWVLPTTNRRLRLETDRFFEKYKVSPLISLESDVISTLAQAVTLGIGVALLPLPYVRSYVKSGELKVLGGIGPLLWKSKIYLLAKREKAMQKDLQKIKNFLKTFDGK